MGQGHTSPASLHINLLGGLQGAGPRPEDLLLLERKKTRALLAILAIEGGGLVPGVRLTPLLWDEQSEDVAGHGFGQSLLDLRRALPRHNIDAIRADSDLIGLDPATVAVDVVRFEHLVVHGTPDALEE